MSAYVISEVEIRDENAARQYRRLAAESIAAYSGRYLIRGAEVHVAEGDPTTRRIVIVEFPSMEHIHRWYTSAQYQKALAFRDLALVRRLTFVEGASD